MRRAILLSMLIGGIPAGAGAGVTFGDTVTFGSGGVFSNSASASAGVSKSVTVRGQVYASRSDTSSDTVKGLSAGASASLGRGWSADLGGSWYPRANDATSADATLTLGRDLALPEPWSVNLSVSGSLGTNTEYLSATDQATLDQIVTRKNLRQRRKAPKHPNPKDPPTTTTTATAAPLDLSTVSFARRWGTLGITGGFKAASLSFSYTSYGYGDVNDRFQPAEVERFLKARNLQLPGVSALTSGLPDRATSVSASQGVWVLTLSAEAARTHFATGESALDSVTGGVAIQPASAVKLTGSYNLIMQDPNPDSHYTAFGVQIEF